MAPLDPVLPRVAPRRALLAGCAFTMVAMLFVGCGSGGSEPTGGEPDPGTGIRLVNAALTAKGDPNTHALVGLSYRSAFGGSEEVLPPFQLAPGEGIDLPVPAGAWNFQALFDDGNRESVQSPGDAVHVYENQHVQVLFMH